MQTNSILDVWDHCVGKNQTIKGASLASLAFHDAHTSNIENWSIEKRDVALFHVRKSLFGNHFNNITNCPHCNQRVEWELDFQQLGIPSLESVPDNVEIPINTPDYHLRVRLPLSNDLFGKDEFEIIKNCILNFKEYQGEAIDKTIPKIIINQINYEFDKVCKASNITYLLSCAECSHEWQVFFDIVSYLWQEIDQWAKTFLDQIYMLAKAFGWSERDIINMSENRRHHYLNLIKI